MKKILLIEDNLEMRENTAEILELTNYHVITAENGKIGIEKAREHMPDLIVCDIMMPEMDGYGVLYAVSKIPSLSGVPFIFLTAKADKSDFRKGMNMGADDYLTKPFNDMELLQAVETRLNKYEFRKKEYDRNSEGFNSFIREVKNFPDLKDISDDYQVIKLEKKQNVFQAGSFPRYLYLINSGIIKMYRTNDEGKEYVTGIFKSGDFVGYLALIEDKPYEESAETMEKTELAIIPKDDFIKLLNSNREVSAKFIKILTSDLATSEENLLKLAYDSVRRRVAEALIKMVHSHNMQDDPRPVFSLSREDIGKMAGTATESAIRALKDFKDEGLIDLKARDIIILKMQALSMVRN